MRRCPCGKKMLEDEREEQLLIPLAGCRWWWGMKRWRMMERRSGCQGDGRCRMLHADNVRGEKSRLGCCKSHFQQDFTLTKGKKKKRSSSVTGFQRFGVLYSVKGSWFGRWSWDKRLKKAQDRSVCFIIAAYSLKVWPLRDKDIGEDAPIRQIHCPSTSPRVDKRGCQERQVSLR